jgi:hypothetical protein
MVPYFCTKCFTADELREEVEMRGELVPSCPVCKSVNVKALPTIDSRFKTIFRALVRLHYSEWDYNSHLGGDYLQTLLFGNNEIFSLSNHTADEMAFEEAFLPLEDEWYPESENEIALGGGYWDGGILVGIRERLEPQVNEVLRTTLSKGERDAESGWRELLTIIRPDIETTLPVESRFFRARVGVKASLQTQGLGGSWSEKFSYLPYRDHEIGAPPAHLCSEGRLNRKGAIALYVASSRDIAIAEVRPYPSHLVTTAEFETVRELRIADFASVDIRRFLSDSRLEDMRRIVSLGAVLNLPAIPELKDGRYRATQLISDCIREAGFDGVSFRSSLGHGSNTVLFDADSAKAIPGSEEVFEVRSVQYTTSSCDTVPKDYRPNDYKIVGDDLVSTTFHGLARFR